MKLTMYRGDTKPINFSCKQANGDPLPLTDMEVTFTLKGSPSEPVIVSKTIADGGVVVTDELSGLLRVTIQPEDTADLYAPSAPVWDLEITTATDEVYTLASGNLHIRPDVT